MSLESLLGHLSDRTKLGLCLTSMYLLVSKASLLEFVCRIKFNCVHNCAFHKKTENNLLYERIFSLSRPPTLPCISSPVFPHSNLMTYIWIVDARKNIGNVFFKLRVCVTVFFFFFFFFSTFPHWRKKITGQQLYYFVLFYFFQLYWMNLSFFFFNLKFPTMVVFWRYPVLVCREKTGWIFLNSRSTMTMVKRPWPCDTGTSSSSSSANSVPGIGGTSWEARSGSVSGITAAMAKILTKELAMVRFTVTSLQVDHSFFFFFFKMKWAILSLYCTKWRLTVGRGEWVVGTEACVFNISLGRLSARTKLDIHVYWLKDTRYWLVPLN